MGSGGRASASLSQLTSAQRLGGQMGNLTMDDCRVKDRFSSSPRCRDPSRAFSKVLFGKKNLSEIQKPTMSPPNEISKNPRNYCCPPVSVSGHFPGIQATPDTESWEEWYGFVIILFGGWKEWCWANPPLNFSVQISLQNLGLLGTQYPPLIQIRCPLKLSS